MVFWVWDGLVLACPCADGTVNYIFNPHKMLHPVFFGIYRVQHFRCHFSDHITNPLPPCIFISLEINATALLSNGLSGSGFNFTETAFPSFCVSWYSISLWALMHLKKTTPCVNTIILSLVSIEMWPTAGVAACQRLQVQFHKIKKLDFHHRTYTEWCQLICWIHLPVCCYITYNLMFRKYNIVLSKIWGAFGTMKKASYFGHQANDRPLTPILLGYHEHVE